MPAFGHELVSQIKAFTSILTHCGLHYCGTLIGAAVAGNQSFNFCGVVCPKIGRKD